MSDSAGVSDTSTVRSANSVESPTNSDETLVKLEGVTKHFDQEKGFLASLFGTDQVRAVEDVSFEIRKGETLGLVGESGCGKSTLARTLLQLVTPTDGDVYFKGENITELSRSELRSKRQDMQLIFQDPQSSLDPRMQVGPIVEEPMRAHDMLDDEGRKRRAQELLETVGLDPQHYNRYPHQFSGGQRQRINLARALSVDPDFIVCDEPVSALDVSIQAQVLNTMRELQEEFGLTYLFIAHDLSVIRHISDRVAVMYLGEIVELAQTKELFEHPQHPYTQALLDAIPIPDPRASRDREILVGDVPSPINPPSGCRFHPRCPELIAPPEHELSEAEWHAVREFTRAVDRRSFEAEEHETIRNEFFEEGLPDGEVGQIIEENINRITENEWEIAAEELNQQFVDPSICASETPDYEVSPAIGSDRHFAACHLHRNN